MGLTSRFDDGCQVKPERDMTGRKLIGKLAILLSTTRTSPCQEAWRRDEHQSFWHTLLMADGHRRRGWFS
jgi:hypothetical protein